MKFVLTKGAMLTKTIKVLKLEILKKNIQSEHTVDGIHAAISEKPDFTDEGGRVEGRTTDTHAMTETLLRKHNQSLKCVREVAFEFFSPIQSHATESDKKSVNS